MYKNDYSRHMKSKKHFQKNTLDNEIVNENNLTVPEGSPICPSKNNIIVCKYCNNTFSRSDKLTQHLKYCKERFESEIQLKEQIKKLETEKSYVIKQLETEKVNFNRDKKHYIYQAKHYKQLFEEAGSIVKKSINAISYISNNYKTAPALKTITIDDFNDNVPNKNKVAEHILSSYRSKTLSKYIGDVIVKVYKKDNPKHQSIWNTDDNRLTYILKEILQNNTKASNWIVDKKGAKTAKYVVKPLLEHIRNLLEEYNLSIRPADYRYDATGMQLLLENSKALLKLCNEIDTGVTSNEILKYISAHLRFNNQQKI